MNRNPYLRQLPLDPDTIALLADHGIHTLGELADAMGDGRLGEFLGDEQRVEAINVVWEYIREILRHSKVEA